MEAYFVCWCGWAGLNMLAIIITPLAATLILCALIVAIVKHQNQKAAEATWRIKLKDITHYNPPIILGNPLLIAVTSFISKEHVTHCYLTEVSWYCFPRICRFLWFVIWSSDSCYILGQLLDWYLLIPLAKYTSPFCVSKLKFSRSNEEIDIQSWAVLAIWLTKQCRLC